jgi:hypothetical protein
MTRLSHQVFGPPMLWGHVSFFGVSDKTFKSHTQLFLLWLLLLLKGILEFQDCVAASKGQNHAAGNLAQGLQLFLVSESIYLTLAHAFCFGWREKI